MGNLNEHFGGSGREKKDPGVLVDGSGCVQAHGHREPLPEVRSRALGPEDDSVPKAAPGFHLTPPASRALFTLNL